MKLAFVNICCMNYDTFHKDIKIQKKTIGQKNFTYRNTLDVLNDIPKANRNTVLDYGCGVGTVDFYLAENGSKVIGLEVSNKAIEICKKSAKKIGVNNNCNFYRLNYKLDKKFDLIICSEVIEHVEDDDGLLLKLSKLLKKGGYIFISTPSINAPLYKMRLLSFFDKRVGHLRRYKPDELVLKINKLNLKIVKFKKIEGILRNSLFVFPKLGWIVKFLRGPISDVVTLIDKFTVRILGESNLIILAQKV